MAGINCLHCGEVNPVGQEFCLNCGEHLQLPSDELQRIDIPIQPDEQSVEKTSGDMEQIQPQWLREARQKTNKTNLDAASRIQGSDRLSGENQDLLAGLRSQSEQEDEAIPDWLARITGIESDRKKAQPKTSEVRWVELGDAEESAEQEASEINATQTPRVLPADEAKKERDSLPGWLAEMQSPPEGGRDELSDWMTQTRMEDEQVLPTVSSGQEYYESQREGQPGDSLSDWLKSLEEEPAKGDQLPDQAHFDQTPGETASKTSPDWLENFQEGLGAGDQGADQTLFDKAAAETTSEPTTDWLAGAAASDQEWLSRLGAEFKEETDPKSRPSEKTPPWLRAQTGSTGSEGTTEAEVPDWLKAAAPKSTFDEPAIKGQTAASEVPEWLKPSSSEPAEAEEESVSEYPENDIQSVEVEDLRQVAAAPEPSAFEDPVPDAFPSEPLSENEMDSLFTELPEWISKSGIDEGAPAAVSQPGSGSETISPVDLPSWVQAMRPVDSVAPSKPSGGAHPVEVNGALAGLHGVLPSLPGGERSTKPKGYGIKLQASEEQQAHAALMERILAAETTPEPIRTLSSLNIQQFLSWSVSALIVLLAGATLLSGSRFFRMPGTWPVAASGALQAVESIPDNAPVLVVVDYEPARLGELEAIAVPLLDHMILLHHPRLAFVSSNPTGGLLAERLIDGSFLAGHHYQNGITYSNLGYLPGGLTGVLAFAQNPGQVKPLDFNNTTAWNSPALLGVNQLANFAALIVLTDNADSARTWIEQAGLYRGSTPFVVGASATAAPMLRPYYDSHQIAGLVSGLSGGAVLEQNNAGRPGGVRAWWDAYSLGLLAAAAMITLGGGWNLLQRLRIGEYEDTV